MTKLNLKPGSKELENILRNRFLFNWYSKMLLEDFESDMNKFKYLGMLTNPEGYMEIEKANDRGYLKKLIGGTSKFKDGKEATETLRKMGLIEEEKMESIEEIE